MIFNNYYRSITNNNNNNQLNKINWKIFARLFLSHIYFTNR